MPCTTARPSSAWDACSAWCPKSYLYSSAGNGESSTDLAWDGQCPIGENGELLAESERFLAESHLVGADVDLERLSHERMHSTQALLVAARAMDRNDAPRSHIVGVTMPAMRPAPARSTRRVG